MSNSNGNSNIYSGLDAKGKQLIEMYITARQFNNAILEEEMIILPAQPGVIEEGTVLRKSDINISFRGKKSVVKIYPFIVNKAFACEVYLKLILVEMGLDVNKLKIHKIFSLYEKTDERFKQSIIEFFINKFTDINDEEMLKKQIRKISEVFQEWRYIYERLDQENIVNYGFLNAFCFYLDRYSQQLIFEKYSYDVAKDMR